MANLGVCFTTGDGNACWQRFAEDGTEGCSWVESHAPGRQRALTCITHHLVQNVFMEWLKHAHEDWWFHCPRMKHTACLKDLDFGNSDTHPEEGGHNSPRLTYVVSWGYRTWFNACLIVETCGTPQPGIEKESCVFSRLDHYLSASPSLCIPLSISIQLM